jgi:nucleolar protein 12
MGKKPKEPKNNLQSTVSSATTNIFQTLFGDAQLQDSTSASIFSDNNPFRRKPVDASGNQKLGLGLGSADETANPISKSQEINAGDVKKRKRDKAKAPTVDSDSEHEIKKSKQILNVNSEEYVDVKEGKKKKKEKRKRDELESNYEAEKYGIVAVARNEIKEAPVVGEKRKLLDQSEDTVASKEGFDDEDKLLRTVFVGNLPLKVKKKALLKEFSQFGEVESVRIRSVPILNSKTPRKGAIIKKQINETVDSVHAYIVFKTEESVPASLTHNMAIFGENHIRVDRACPPRKKLKGENSLLYDNKRTVFVGNLPFDVTDEEIYRLFSGINNMESSIEAVRVVRDPGTSLGKGIAYVLFKTREAAMSVVRKRNLKIRDRDLRLSHSKASTTPLKRENPSPSSDKYNNSRSKKFAPNSGLSDRQTMIKSIAASGSYQGLRASKSGVQKKISTGPAQQPARFSMTPKTPKMKERSGKRPAVAARRGGGIGSGGSVSGGGGKQFGKKRKHENKTPDSSRRGKDKKPRKFR